MRFFLLHTFLFFACKIHFGIDLTRTLSSLFGFPGFFLLILSKAIRAPFEKLIQMEIEKRMKEKRRNTFGTTKVQKNCELECKLKGKLVNKKKRKENLNKMPKHRMNEVNVRIKMCVQCVVACVSWRILNQLFIPWMEMYRSNEKEKTDRKSWRFFRVFVCVCANEHQKLRKKAWTIRAWLPSNALICVQIYSRISGKWFAAFEQKERKRKKNETTKMCACCPLVFAENDRFDWLLRKYALRYINFI